MKLGETNLPELWNLQTCSKVLYLFSLIVGLLALSCAAIAHEFKGSRIHRAEVKSSKTFAIGGGILSAVAAIAASYLGEILKQQ